MATDVGMVSIEYIENTTGIVGEFITYLASNANRIGNQCALGFYLQEGMEQTATEYLDLYPPTPEQVYMLYAWIKALPWKEGGRLALVFNW